MEYEMMLHVGRQMGMAYLVGRRNGGDRSVPEYTSPKAKRWYAFYAENYAKDDIDQVAPLPVAYASWVIMETTSREIDPKDTTTLCEVDSNNGN